MKNFRKEYNNLLKEIKLSKKEITTIKDNILKSNDKKIYLKAFLYASFAILLFISCIITTRAIINSYKIVENIETMKNIIFNEKVNKEYNKDLLVEKKYYKKDILEDKLELKILDNKLINSNNYKLDKLTFNKNKIAKLNFWLVNEDNTSRNIEQINFAFEINTKYSEEESKFALSGYSKLENYFIKNLNTEAVIIEANNEKFGPILCNFVYNEIIYSIELEKLYYKIEDMHKILDSFY